MHVRLGFFHVCGWMYFYQMTGSQLCYKSAKESKNPSINRLLDCVRFSALFTGWLVTKLSMRN